MAPYKRAKKRVFWGSSITVIIAVLGLIAVFAPGRSGAVVNGSPSNFESSDGNMTVQGNPGADWNCFANGKASGFVSSGINTGTGTCSSALKYANAAAIHPGTTETTTNETAWKSGQKMDTACPTLDNKSTTSVPNKDDFTDIAQYFEIDSHLNEYLYGAEERLTANGNSSGNVELNQVGSTAGCPIDRTAGDRLLAFNFTGGGTTLEFGAFTWITPADLTAGGNNGTCNIGNDSPPCWGANEITNTGTTPTAGITVGGCGTSTTSPFTNDVEGCSNQSTIQTSDNGIGFSGPAGNFAANSFAEFGVNLTKVLGLGPCNPFAQETYESRSSGSSFTSNPEDIEVLSKQLATCGSITIIKHTTPRGVNQSFGYTTTGGLSPSTFSLNDNGCTVASCTGNTQAYTNVPEGTYSVTEGAEPTGFTFGSLSCLNNGSADSGITINGTTATIVLQPNDKIVCTYVNNQMGAIKITKVSSKSASVTLAGATFEMCTNAGPYTTTNPCTAPTGVTNPLGPTPSSGVLCVSGLPRLSTTGTTYYVQELSAPSGYAIDPANHGVLVNQGGTCSTGTQATLTVQDVPLTDLTITASSEATGGTKSQITCTNSSSQNIGNSPSANLATANVTANGLKPGTYTCTVVVDP